MRTSFILKLDNAIICPSFYSESILKGINHNFFHLAEIARNKIGKIRYQSYSEVCGAVDLSLPPPSCRPVATASFN